ncbi:fibronectin type III domain-containing protein [Geobacter sp. FeAm09]|uniref:fibronectin type III domain-containing protein n=1 Tax=Geobacter sp. FeAm09 TaxID=2597769 RepID=UPI00197A70EA|nr:fibronectin type III domain-containing protein [Geobacter sp. FeAm09]
MKLRSVIQLLALAAILAGFCLSGCSVAGEDAWRYEPGIPGKVTGFTAKQGDQLVSLSWDTLDNAYTATSYNVYYVAATNTDAITKTNSTKINVTRSQTTISGLTNGVTYYFMVTAQNRYGESEASIQVAETPKPKSPADLTGTWYFHTLVSGPSAKWERGTIVIDDYGAVTFTEFLDSDHYNPADDSSTAVTPPADVNITMQSDKSLALSGSGAWVDFHGIMGSRKNMLLGNWTYSVDGSKAITIFQKKRDTDDYDVWDVSGTGNQNPHYPELAGNGPTRYAYHALNSGASVEWEYSNARVGQQAQFWTPDASLTGAGNLFPDGIGSIKDIIYWDYSTPTYKMTPMWDLMWKVTCFGVQPDGLVKEYDSYAEPSSRKDAKQNVIFTGRMTDDKTVIVGVSTKKEVKTGTITPNQFYLRVLQFNFKPTDQALPTYDLNDLAGTYLFHKIGAVKDSTGASTATWAYGKMQVTSAGVTTFPTYVDSKGATSSADTFTLAYYPDPGSDAHTWTTFANFVSPDTGAADAYSRYYDANGQPYFSVYTWWNLTSSLTPMSTSYYNEHATLSYNQDLVVMTRTDASGHSFIIGLK